MKKIIRNIIISSVIFLVLVSIGANAYWGYKQIEASLIQKGFNTAVGQVIQQVQQTGSVQLSPTLILIPKPNASTNK